MLLSLFTAVAAVAAAPQPSSVSFRGVPLGISAERLRQLRPAAACKMPFGTLYCEEKLARSAELPLKSGNGSVDYNFSEQGELREITFWADYEDDKWVEAFLRRTWGSPDSTQDEDGDPELKWRRDGATIRFNPDCEDGLICVEYKLTR